MNPIMLGEVIRKPASSLLPVLLIATLFIGSCDVANALETHSAPETTVEASDGEYCNCDTRDQLEYQVSITGSTKTKVVDYDLELEQVFSEPAIVVAVLPNYLEPLPKTKFKDTSPPPDWPVTLARSHL